MARSNSSKTTGNGRANSRGLDTNLALFSLNGPFAQYAGPALVAGPNATVLASNDAAEELSELVKAGGPAELRTAVETALEGRSAQLSPLLIPAGANGAAGDGGSVDEQMRALDLVILPWSEGSAVLVLGRDMTLDRRLRQALIESQQRYKDIIALMASDFAWETDGEGRFAYISPNGGLGYAGDELADTMASSHAEEAEAARKVFSARSTVVDRPMRLRRRDGTLVEMMVSGAPVLSGDGAWRGARGLCRDVSTRTAAQRSAERGHKREKLLSAILRMAREEATPQAMLDTIAAGLPAALGSEGTAIYRLVEGEFGLVARAGGQAPAKLMHDLLARIEAGERSVDATDTEMAVLARATSRHEEVNGLVFLWRDRQGPPWSEQDRQLVDTMTEQAGDALRRLARQEEIARLSASDPLTGLPNRRSFLDNLSKRLGGQAGAARHAGTLLYIEATNFKLVNTRRGHHAGDQVLASLGRLLQNQVGQEDLIGRLEGDAFAIFLEETASDAAVQRARNLVKAAREAFGGETGDPVQPLGIAVGVASYDPARPEGVSDLLERGQRAMNRMKRSGGDAVGVSELRRA